MNRKIKDYEIIEKIASGGMADVYKAKKIGIRGFTKIFAIKVIKEKISADPKLKSMFVQEAELSSNLINPNIVQIFELGEDKDRLFIVMEYIHGKNLKEVNKFIGFQNIKWEMSAYIILKSAIALFYAHSLKDNYGNKIGIVHRDVSPQNIMVTFNGDVKLADFGIAKVENKGETDKNILVGKYPYMSPEQTRGDNLDYRSDIFSLGIVFYQLLTGKLPFIGTNGSEVIRSIRNHIPEPPYKIKKTIPVEVSNIIMKCLEKEPDFRYKTTMEVAKALEKFVPNVIAISDELGRLLLEKYTMNLSNNLSEKQIDTKHPSSDTEITDTITSLLGLLRENPNNVEYLEKIGVAYAFQGNYEKAMEYYTRGLAENDSNFMIRFRLAQLFIREKDKYDFSHQYNILKKLEPKNPLLNLLELQHQIAYKKWDDAEKDIKKLKNDFQDNVDFLLLESEFFSHKKKYTKVINNYIKIAEIEPEYYFFKEKARNLVEDMYSSIFDGGKTTTAKKQTKKVESKIHRKALVIDDDKNMRIFLKIILTDLGFSVDVAKNAFNVEKLLELHDYNFIVLDILMPGQNGFNLLKELKKKNLISEKMIIFMISGVYKTTKFKLMAHDLGVVEYIEKPFAAPKFTKLVRKYLNVSVN
jgi:serine/threonine protein kinase